MRERVFCDQVAALVEADGPWTFVNREERVDGGRIDICALSFPREEVRVIEAKVARAGLLKAVGQLHLYGLEFAHPEWKVRVRRILAIPPPLATDLLRQTCKSARVELWAVEAIAV